MCVCAAPGNGLSGGGAGRSKGSCRVAGLLPSCPALFPAPLPLAAAARGVLRLPEVLLLSVLRWDCRKQASALTDSAGAKARSRLDEVVSKELSLADCSTDSNLEVSS